MFYKIHVQEMLVVSRAAISMILHFEILLAIQFSENILNESLPIFFEFTEFYETNIM